MPLKLQIAIFQALLNWLKIFQDAVKFMKVKIDSLHCANWSLYNKKLCGKIKYDKNGTKLTQKQQQFIFLPINYNIFGHFIPNPFDNFV